MVRSTGITPCFCFGEGSGILADVERAATAYGVRVGRPNAGSHGTASISAGRGKGKNPVTAMLEGHGLMGLRSAEKFVPDAIFGLDDEQIARFLGVMYACDGHVYCSDRLAQIGYTTISERLAHDVQHLLLRLGIVATIRALKRAVYEGTDKVAREVRITSQSDMRRFCELIRVPGKEVQAGSGLGAARRRAEHDEHGHDPTRDLGRHATRQGREALGRHKRSHWPVTNPQLARRQAQPVSRLARRACGGHEVARARGARPIPTSGGTRSSPSSTSAKKRPTTSTFQGCAISSPTT